MTQVVCVGIAVLDRIYRVDRFWTRPGKHRATERSVAGGGVAANAAVTVVRLGGAARFCGVLGDDETGRAILDDLRNDGVDVDWVDVVEGAQSPESVVQIDSNGERLIVNHASPDLFQRTIAASDVTAGAAAVLVDMRWNDGAAAALEAAQRSKVPAIVDCDHDPTDSPAILEQATHVVFGAETLRQWTDSTRLGAGLEVAQERTGAWVGVTDGVHGTFWLEDNELRHQPAFRVDAVDTLGAGDVFHGAFALALAEGRGEEDAIVWASAAAALKCTRFGGRAGIPNRAELDEFLESR